METGVVSAAKMPHLKGIYVLFGVSVFLNVLFPLAVLWVFWQRSHATQWAESHYRYLLISSAWVTGLMLISAFLILAKMKLGLWLVVPIKLWFAYRLFKGVSALIGKRAI